MALLPNQPEYKWTKWACYFLTVPFVISLFLAWSLIPSNTAGRTKRTLTSSFTFVGYCVGNMVGSQIFKAEDAPRYIPGTIGCAVCFALQFLLIVTWRIVLLSRNKRREKEMANDGLTEEERARRAKELGESDATDFENRHVSFACGFQHMRGPILINRNVVPLYALSDEAWCARVDVERGLP